MNELTSVVVCRMTEGGRTFTDVANYVCSPEFILSHPNLNTPQNKVQGEQEKKIRTRENLLLTQRNQKMPIRFCRCANCLGGKAFVKMSAMLLWVGT